MSFKLFFLNAFGGIKSTSKVEEEHNRLWKNYQEFLQVRDSEELKSFLELEKFVQSDEFIKTKKKIQSLNFKGSDEEKQLKEYNKLQKDKKLKKYYQTVGSANIKKYQDLEESDTLKRYNELKVLADRGQLKGDKEKNDEFNKLKGSESIRFFNKYPKSSEYKNYKAIHSSPVKSRFEDLKEVVSSEEFISRKSYLEDAKKWEKTDEFQKEQLYNEMKGKPHFVNYFKYKHSNAFDFFESWNLVFEDQFEGKDLNKEKWSTISKVASETVGKNFSKVGDLQAYTSNGENIIATDGNLKIESRKEKINSLIWSPVGFQEIEMNYSSGLLTTANIFEPRFGILEAKIKYDPQKELVDVFYLAGEDQSIRVNLVEIGKVNRLGLSVGKNGDWQHHGITLGGLSTGKSYIFRMEWERGKLCWKINGKEVYSATTDVPIDEMNINLATLVVEDTIKLPHRYNVEWVRFFQRK
ncbi:glycoside hydrolase family 16 protein [Sunxiuqinia sp. A32]|uniref:glycoside hydrolase family 16 protein n=1 Tax=Sunxiuqinia sp. A32 TaxID=3461496 RepID=UPI0040462EB2